MKPLLRKIKGEWVCRRRGTINGYGRTAHQAYYEWVRRNAPVFTPQWHGYFGDAGGPL